MRKFFKWIGVSLLVILVVLGIFGLIIHEKQPAINPSKEADILAQEMLTRLNHTAYKNTRHLEWSFQNGKNIYQWDKKKGLVQMNMGDTKLLLNLSFPQKSKVLAPKNLQKTEKQELIAKGIANFNNDSFWLVAPYKVLDKGTKRTMVELEDGSKGLMVTYMEGGSTPGDSYLWILDENGFPKSFKMWVSIIPIGGLEATWDDWLVTESGAFLPKSHKLGPFNLNMGNVAGHN